MQRWRVDLPFPFLLLPLPSLLSYPALSCPFLLSPTQSPTQSPFSALLWVCPMQEAPMPTPNAAQRLLDSDSIRDDLVRVDVALSGVRRKLGPRDLT